MSYALKLVLLSVSQWRDRLVNALKEIKVGKPVAQAANDMSENNGRTEWTRDSDVSQILEVYSIKSLSL